MKRRVGLVTKCMIGALLSGTALVLPGVQAQAADFPVKATEAVPYWWFHGEVEAGGRFFLNDPKNGKQTANTTVGGFGQLGPSLAGYYEYSDNRPGPFGNIDAAVGTSDGLYQFNFLGSNIGYNDQSYHLDFSKAGEHYLNLGWDQSPHVYSTSALTPFTVKDNIVTAGKLGTTALADAPFATPTDIGIKRDTASVEYRWTPTDAWDIKADWSHLARTGTQVGAVHSGVTPDSQFPKPVNDTTQNFGLTGEYAGTSPWGKKLTFKAGYKGSQYTDNYASYLVVSPSTGVQGNAEFAAFPSNQANGGTTTLAADLPLKSRYVGTLNYTYMTQNAAFIPMAYGVAPNNTTATLPALSLNGKIGTTLFNNVVTTKITPELSNKLSYRYYDFNNSTPELNFTIAQLAGSGFGVTKVPVNSLSINYTKQNAGEELVWRPTKEWNFGAAYGYERYDWARTDVNATNENSGKIFADWKPNSWFSARSSGYYGVRRYQTYDYLGRVGNYQWLQSGAQAPTSYQYAQSYRQLMYDNRNVAKVNLAFDIVVLPRLTITPTFKYEDDYYGLDGSGTGTGQQGLDDSKKWSAGIDATYLVNPGTSIMVGYMYEKASQLLFGCSGEGSSNSGTNQCTPATAALPMTLTNDDATVHTITAAVRYAAIPDKLDTELRYVTAFSVDSMRLYMAGNNPAVADGGQFTDNKGWFQRVDASAVYKFDKETVTQLGWKGDIKAKLRYTWERNSATNSANDGLLPYSTMAGSSSVLWMAWNNPNYNVHMLAASLVASW